MAPRRRRSKNSAVAQAAQQQLQQQQQQQQPNTGSGTNSAITSSPSQPTSKSEDSALITSPLANVENNDPFNVPNKPHVTKNENSLDEIDSHKEDTTLNDNFNKNRNNHLTKCYEKSQQQLQQDDTSKDYFTVADVTMNVCMDFVKWALTDMAIQFKRQAFLALENERRLAQFKKVPSSQQLTDGGRNDTKKGQSTDIKYGSNLLFNEKGVTVECSNCPSSVSAARYAQHVEKCSGRGGRMSSRAASARMRANAERFEKETNVDIDEPPTRKRRGMSSTANHVHSGVGEGNGHPKRRRPSPTTSGGSSAVSPNSTSGRHSGGLPPSGRNRSTS